MIPTLLPVAAGGAALCQSPFFILPTWLVFRFAPGYPRHTLPEGCFLQVFLSTLSLLLSFLDYVNEDIENVLVFNFVKLS